VKRSAAVVACVLVLAFAGALAVTWLTLKGLR
jgi:hypothetical protein